MINISKEQSLAVWYKKSCYLCKYIYLILIKIFKSWLIQKKEVSWSVNTNWNIVKSETERHWMEEEESNSSSSSSNSFNQFVEEVHEFLGYEAGESSSESNQTSDSLGCFVDPHMNKNNTGKHYAHLLARVEQERPPSLMSLLAGNRWRVIRGSIRTAPTSSYNRKPTFDDVISSRQIGSHTTT